jgi:hypothetical protein
MYSYFIKKALFIHALSFRLHSCLGIFLIRYFLTSADTKTLCC